MKDFRRATAWRIAVVSLLLALLTSPVAWWVAREQAEENMVAMAREESERILHFHEAFDLNNTQAVEHAASAAAMMIGGLFEIAELYDRDGRKLAESATQIGHAIEPLLPKHGRPDYGDATYENINLPDGRWVLRVMVPLREKTPNAMVSGYFEGVRVIPDWQRDELSASAFRVSLMVALAALLCGLTIYPVVIHLSADNARKAREVLDSHISMMEALGRAVALRDSDTGIHNYRVAWISARLGEKMGLSGADMQALIAGSFLHDVGKIGIPDAILLKPGKLDADEMVIMRTHVAQGEEIVTGLGWLDGAQAVVAAHHEKWDGSGYPRGLAGQAIPLAARIFAVADVFDALCSKRPYKEPLRFESAMAIMERDTGKHFDRSVMAVFRPLAPELHARLAAAGEAEIRQLLEERIREHFGL